MPECALKGYLVECSGGCQLHHIINRGKARGNPRVRQELDCNELTAWVCAKHNTTKLADTKEARAILLKQKVLEFGYDHMNNKINGLSWKVPKPEFSLDAMLAGAPVTNFLSGEEMSSTSPSKRLTTAYPPAKIRRKT